jgi:hypothetical protein
VDVSARRIDTKFPYLDHSLPQYGLMSRAVTPERATNIHDHGISIEQRIAQHHQVDLVRPDADTIGHQGTGPELPVGIQQRIEVGIALLTETRSQFMSVLADHRHLPGVQPRMSLAQLHEKPEEGARFWRGPERSADVSLRHHAQKLSLDSLDHFKQPRGVFEGLFRKHVCYQELIPMLMRRQPLRYCISSPSSQMINPLDFLAIFAYNVWMSHLPLRVAIDVSNVNMGK